MVTANIWISIEKVARFEQMVDEAKQSHKKAFQIPAPSLGGEVTLIAYRDVDVETILNIAIDCGAKGIQVFDTEDVDKPSLILDILREVIVRLKKHWFHIVRLIYRKSDES